jgi:hypothetical protein
MADFADTAERFVEELERNLARNEVLGRAGLQASV